MLVNREIKQTSASAGVADGPRWARVFLLQIQNEGRFFLVDDVTVHMARASDSSATSPVIHIHIGDNKKRTEEDFAPYSRKGGVVYL